jgi:hypothetical protein
MDAGPQTYYGLCRMATLLVVIERSARPPKSGPLGAGELCDLSTT